jgi:hypothetical protein
MIGTFIINYELSSMCSLDPTTESKLLKCSWTFLLGLCPNSLGVGDVSDPNVGENAMKYK